MFNIGDTYENGNGTILEVENIDGNCLLVKHISGNEVKHFKTVESLLVVNLLNGDFRKV